MERRPNNLVKKCRVCGDKALGFNFNGLSCESCKIFFRRNALRYESFKCSKGMCVIDQSTRKCCPRCRLEKCFQIGMKKELIRNKRSSTDSLTSSHSPFSDDSGSANSPADPLANFQPYHRDLITELMNAKSIFNDEAQMKIVTHCKTIAEVFVHSAAYIRNIIKFCKSIESFKSLNQKDQLVLLKEFFIDHQAIHFSFVYNRESDGISMKMMNRDNEAVFIKLSIFYQWSKINVVSIFRQFIQIMSYEMENDQHIRNLLIAIQLFKAQENISNPELIRYHHYVYRYLLKRYLYNKYDNNFEKAEKKFEIFMTCFEELITIKELSSKIYSDVNSQINSRQALDVLNEILILDD